MVMDGGGDCGGGVGGGDRTLAYMEAMPFLDHHHQNLQRSCCFLVWDAWEKGAPAGIKCQREHVRRSYHHQPVLGTYNPAVVVVVVVVVVEGLVPVQKCTTRNDSTEEQIMLF